MSAPKPLTRELIRERRDDEGSASFSEVDLLALLDRAETAEADFAAARSALALAKEGLIYWRPIHRTNMPCDCYGCRALAAIEKVMP